MIRAVIFDKDGTLFDFRQSWGDWAARLLADLAGDEAERARLGAAVGFDTVARDFHPDSPVIAGTAAEVAEALQAALPGRAAEDLLARINRAAAAAQMVPAVRLRPLLEALRAQGLAIGLATNDAEAPAEAHLAAHGLRDLFDFVAGYDSGHGGKPAPGQLLAFAQVVGVDPRDCAMVGDSLHDLEAAQAAGMARVAVLTGIAKREVLAPHADVVLADIGGLPAWLAARAAGW